jgi:aminodeoxyfutalosine deaminase
LSGGAPPKIELHVHLEGTVRPATLLELARRNDVRLPADTEQGLAELYAFRDMQHFIEVWILTTQALRRRDDFRQVVVDYAAQAARQGAVYIEGIFSPIGQAMRGVAMDEVFAGYCEGAEQARELHGVEVRLTPDIHRGATGAAACEVAERAVAWRERGVVGLGLGGHEDWAPDAAYVEAFEIARAGGLGSVPHAGEIGDAGAVRSAIELLGADRVRHGIRAADDPDLMAELAEREIVLDVCPSSNVATGAVPSLGEHPLPMLVAAGVACSISTDDPAMFDTDLTREYEVAASLDVSPAAAYRAGLRGALCEAATHDQLTRIGTAAGYIGPSAPAV